MEIPEQFSEKEKAVIELLLQGKSNKQIALDLHVTPRTIEYHLTNIYNKLGVNSRSEAILCITNRFSVFPKILDGNLRETTVVSPPERVNNIGANTTSRRKLMITKKYIYVAIALLVCLALAYTIYPRIFTTDSAAPRNTDEPGGSVILSPSPNHTQIEVLPEDQARQVLLDFLNYLNKGNYEKAALLYGGSYNIMMEHNPAIDPNDHVALLRNACTINGAQCLQVSSIDISPGPYENINAVEFKFEIGFINPDGTVFLLGPCCGGNSTDTPPQSIFNFIVKKVDETNYRVMDLPPYSP